MARGNRRMNKVRQTSKNTARRQADTGTAGWPRPTVRSLAVNAFALSGAIVSVLSPVHAVTLGELAVESRLGQPLSARVPVSLQAGESLAENCVSAPVSRNAELGQLPQPSIIAPVTGAPGIYDLRLTTTQALYEPMYELQLQVRCPGTALVVRQYVLMLDLPGTAAAPASTSVAPVVAPSVTSSTSPVAAAGELPRQSTPPRRPVNAEPIENGVRYRVQSGDTLSTIAARISNRGGQTIWATADRIFAANPDAFINGNPDLIKLGSEIVVPAAVSVADLAGVAQPDAAGATGPEPVQAPPAVEAPAMVPGPEASATEPLPAEVASTPGEAEPQDAVQPAPAAIFQDEALAEAEPESPAAADAEVAAPAAEAVATPAETSDGTPAWLAALVGVLLGAAASLLLLRDRLLGALRGLKRDTSPVIAPLARTSVEKPAAAPAPVVTGRMIPREPSMVVVEEPRQEPEHPVATTPENPEADVMQSRSGLRDPAMDSDLSGLFGEHTTGELPDSFGADHLPTAAELDLDLSAATPDTPVDEDIGWIGDETSLSPTQEMPTEEMPRAVAPADSTAEQLDLRTLSQRAVGDTQISQTLKDALNLLESDYEDELTASQVIDQKKLKEILDDDDDSDEDTMARTGTDKFRR